MIFLLPAYLFDYAERRNIIPCSQKCKLKAEILSLVVKKVSWKQKYYYL
jgi:hypothetical protein